MAELLKTGGGTFDRSHRGVYFLASGVGRLSEAHNVHDYLLIAVNEISAVEVPILEDWIASGTKLLIDSGIFSLAMDHARAHGVPHNIGLALAPEAIDGFDALWHRYIDVVALLESRCWGYIELDQGGRENKIKTRAKLEALGFRPIPVYHPFTDGWDYFDYLAERYDRMCIGNVVMANAAERMRLAATIWERKRRYPDLWIHLLGHTPDQRLHAYPLDSADSSSWLTTLRWSASDKEKACGAAFSGYPTNFRYALGVGDGPTGGDKATQLAGVRAHFIGANWQHYLAALEELGCTLSPPLSS